MSRQRFCANWTALLGMYAATSLCALGLVEPVHASCGDWLEHGAPLRPFEEPWLDGATPLSDLPCQGPGCRQAPVEAPPVLPAPLVMEQRERLCAVANDSILIPATRRILPPMDEQAPLEIMRDRIDRPPRMAG